MIYKYNSSSITDFLLPKKPATIDYLLSFNETQPEIFKEDYKNSIKAAFVYADFLKMQNKYFPEIKLYKTFGANFLMIAKTKSYKLENDVYKIWKTEFAKLNKQNKFNYRLMSNLFLFDGLF